MEFITKSIKKFANDVNQEDSNIITIFQHMVTIYFTAAMWLGVPIMFYLIIMMFIGF